MAADPICEYLQWDSEFFGRRIARAKVASLTEVTARDIQSWCDHHRIDCLYFLADSTDPITPRLAEANHFQFVDIRITLDRSVGTMPAGDSCQSKIRTSTEQDIPALRALARRSHGDTRFYFDGNFSTSLCDAMYETWIEKSCRGWAENVLVAEHAGEPVGYITCHRRGAKTGQIGLVAVAGSARGRGLGRELVCGALRWFSGEGAETVSVVTQGRNVRAQRLYQRDGFITRTVELWYHRWFCEKPRSA